MSKAAYINDSEAQVRRGLEFLHAGTELIELRPLMPDDRWWQGIYDDREKLVAHIVRLNEIEAPAVYWTINPIRGKPTNAIRPAKRGCCVKNIDVTRIRTLFLDYDSKGSRDAVRDLAARVEGYLAGQGWPPPLFVDSGTGYYHFFKLDLAVEKKHVVKTIITNLADRFDTDEAIIDRKCANPGRIARIPGTFNRKGYPRMARIIEEAV